MKRGTIFFFAMFLFAGSMTAKSAVLLVSNGNLVGATGVMVGSDIFDVTFVDGTCIGLFDGCNDAGDFAFTTKAAADAAGKALHNQVFIDTGQLFFDSDPELTIGCIGNVVNCRTIIPYSEGVPFRVDAEIVINTAQLTNSTTTRIGLNIGLDTTSSNGDNYALFTPVPLPGAAILYISGLIAVGSLRRKYKLILQRS